MVRRLLERCSVLGEANFAVTFLLDKLIFLCYTLFNDEGNELNTFLKGEKHERDYESDL